MQFLNGCNKVVIELSGEKFWFEIIAACLSLNIVDFQWDILDSGIHLDSDMSIDGFF